MKIEDSFAKNEVIFNNKFKNIGDDKNANEDSSVTGFGDILKKCMDDTNDKMIKSNEATNSFIKGDDVSIDEVMVKGEEASLSLQFLTHTRDKLLEGYNEISKMQL